MVGEDRRVILAARQVVKDYAQGDGVRRMLDHLSLEVDAGRFVAIMGPSGSGKSTLLHLLGGLDTPDAGEVELDGTTLSSLSDEARTRLRRHRIGGAIGASIELTLPWAFLPPLLVATLVVAAVASIVPARRAGRNEPVAALRFD